MDPRSAGNQKNTQKKFDRFWLSLVFNKTIYMQEVPNHENHKTTIKKNHQRRADLKNYEEKLLTIYRDLGNYLDGMAKRGVMGKEIQATREPTNEYLEHPLYKGFAEARTGLGVMIKFLRNELKEISKP